MHPAVGKCALSMCIAIISASSTGVLSCAPLARSQPSIADSRAAIRELHRRYAGKRFTHVTFVQTTEHADGSTETWYEALAPRGRVRVDIAPLSGRNGFMYRSDSQYVFRDGRVTQAYGNQKWLSMLVLLDIFSAPLDSVFARMGEVGVNLDAYHAGTWRDRSVHVVGAMRGDTLSPQVWLDQDHLYPVRLIQRGMGTGIIYDWDISGHRFLDGGWIETEIRLYSAGKLLVRERYDQVTPRRTLPDSLFDPSPYRPPAWLGAASVREGFVRSDDSVRLYYRDVGNAPYEGGREWAAALSNATLLTVPRAAHQVFNDYPEVFFPAVERFLRGEP